MIQVVIFGLDPWTDQKFFWAKEYNSGCTLNKNETEFKGVVSNGNRPVFPDTCCSVSLS